MRCSRAVGRPIEAEPGDVVHVSRFRSMGRSGGRRAAPRFRSSTRPSPRRTPTSSPSGSTTITTRWLQPTWRSFRPKRPASLALSALPPSGIEVIAPGLDVGALDWTEVPRFGRACPAGARSLPPRAPETAVARATARIAALRHVRASSPARRIARDAHSAIVMSAGPEEIVDARGEPSLGGVAAVGVCLAPPPTSPPPDSASAARTFRVSSTRRRCRRAQRFGAGSDDVERCCLPRKTRARSPALCASLCSANGSRTRATG